MKWAGFWARFRSAIHDNRGLDDTQKLTYLREAIIVGWLSENMFTEWTKAPNFVH